MDKIVTFLNSPFVNTIIDFIKKISSSKNYWSLSYLVLLFTFREAFAWKWGEKINFFVEQQLLVTVSKNEELFWKAIEFIFSSGSIELVILGTFIFFVISFMKMNESNSIHINIKLKKNLPILGVFVILLIVLNYLNNSYERVFNMHKQETVLKQKKIDKLEKENYKLKEEKIQIKIENALLKYKLGNTPKAKRDYQ
jgi:cell division protein FtsB